MSESKHAPLPYWVEDVACIASGREDDHITVAAIVWHTTAMQTEATRQFIVRACNSHYQLLEACKAVLAGWNMIGSRVGDTRTLSQAISKVRLAVAAAEGAPFVESKDRS